ncbi:unnamed protein product (macronuclear) [Paramecium tetraurelia]|uniref:Kinesin-like protein n=1 Tax=Paramecium tetraurelia TaxID=5888 RepID=A0DKF9_PARTE|nr:uncharacterized protein GSPATT00017856001 [Paramecium tetraurelia]CAK83526.1 unnamed protein product [Paramecium tetraurelia]|eukprot:XP_001450923.1 hypothetical protein (macronuclear) [Paramecium tetraurelia strain d4-2]
MSYNSKTIDLILKVQEPNQKQFTSFQQFFKTNNPPPLLFEKNITPKNVKAQRSFSNKTQDSIKETKRKSLSQLKYPEYRMLKIYARIKPGECQLNFDKQSILIETNSYNFDRVFEQSATQVEIFDVVAKQTVDDFLHNINGCLIAYGQTGSGKTFTMFGESNDPGIVLRTFTHLFKRNQETIYVSILEIYKDHVYDLVSGVQDLKLKEDLQLGFYVDGLKKIKVDKLESCTELLQIAEENRHVAETKLNALSSRSHLILTIQMGRAKLHLVDLAGSEKVNKTGAIGETLQEAKKINYSLSCLGHVIQCLSQGQDHIPYRDSKLTKLLMDSLQADCRTSIIVAISPENKNQDETVSSLKFAQRARFIKKEIRIATQKKTYRDLELEISQLKQELLETKQRMSQTSSVSHFQCRYITDSEIPCSDSLRLTYRSLNTENKENCLPNLKMQENSAQLELDKKISQIQIELQGLNKEQNLDNVKKQLSKINELTIEMKKSYKLLVSTQGLNNNHLQIQSQFIETQQEQNKQLQKIAEQISNMDSSKPSFNIAINNMIKNLQQQQKQNIEDMQSKLEKMYYDIKKTTIAQDYNLSHLALKLVASPNRQQQYQQQQYQQIKRSKSKTSMNPSVKYLKNKK